MFEISGYKTLSTSFCSLFWREGDKLKFKKKIKHFVLQRVHQFLNPKIFKLAINNSSRKINKLKETEIQNTMVDRTLK